MLTGLAAYLPLEGRSASDWRAGWGRQRQPLARRCVPHLVSGDPTTSRLFATLAPRRPSPQGGGMKRRVSSSSPRLVSRSGRIDMRGGEDGRPFGSLIYLVICDLAAARQACYPQPSRRPSRGFSHRQHHGIAVRGPDLGVHHPAAQRCATDPAPACPNVRCASVSPRRQEDYALSVEHRPRLVPSSAL